MRPNYNIDNCDLLRLSTNNNKLKDSIKTIGFVFFKYFTRFTMI